MQDKNIELRSDKVRNIVGKAPSSLTRYGIGIIAGVVVLGMLVCYMIPYTETYTINMSIYSDSETFSINAPVDGLLTYKVSNQVEENSVLGTIVTVNPSDKSELLSPASGKLFSYVDDLSKVSAGELLFVIISDSDKVYAEAYVPASMSKKIELNQKVQIESTKHSTQEYGFIKGIVSKIYPYEIRDNNNVFKIVVDLSNGLQTTSNKTISLEPNLSGAGHIIVSEQRLIEKILGIKKAK